MSQQIPPKALDQHIAVLGKTGSGKTYAAKVIVEGLLKEGSQVCVVDPTGAWWGLRIGADGKSKGFDRVVLVGGKRGDVPLSPRSGAAVARLVTEQGASVVLDTTAMTVGEYTRWFIDFAGTLYTTIRSPLHLVIDEAHYFMPQGKAPDVDAGKMIHAGNRLMSGGRSLGIRGMMITQRPAKLHKDSLTCADTLIAMRVIAPQDRQAIQDWVDGAGDAEQGKRVISSLAQLGRGEGWVWYPEGGFLERVKFPAIRTYDSSSTPTHGAQAGPKVGEIKLDEVRAAMAEAIRESEANDPALLRKRISELQQQLAAKPTAKPVTDAAAVERAVRTARMDIKKAVAPIMRQIAGTAARLAVSTSKVTEEQESLASSISALAILFEAPLAAAPSPAPAAGYTQSEASAARRSDPAPRATQPRSPVEGLTGPESRILGGLATCLALGLDFPARTLVAACAGYSPTSTGYTNPLGSLRSKGLITYPNAETLKLTDEGRRAAPAIEPITSLAELHRRVLDILSGPERRILEALLDRGPGRMLRADNAERAGYSPTSTGYTNPLGALRSKGFLDYPDSSSIQATSALFPEVLA